MKIIAFSDSHGSFENLQEVVLNNKDTNLFLHLGDCVSEFDDIKSVYNKYVYENVSGNCDFDEVTSMYKVILAKKKRILITHGHNFCVKKGLDNIKELMIAQNIDIALFGHTHIPVIEKWEGRYIINPGSISFPRQSNHELTYAEIIINGNDISPSIKILK